MRFRDFEINDHVPALKAPHALTVLRPWIDAGNAGSLILSSLENYLGSGELARLALPGDYYDLTLGAALSEKSRDLDFPNTTISYSQGSKSQDFLFLRLLEPQMLAEEYVDSVVELLQALGVTRYCLIGSMYDMVPHTRPLLVTGAASKLSLQNQLAVTRVIPERNDGTNTIHSLIEQKLTQLGIETCSLIVHLPGYLTMEDEYRGEKRLVEVLSSLYEFSLSQMDELKANQQEEQVQQLADRIVQLEPAYKTIFQKFEANYDSRIRKASAATRLSPEIEKFLQDLEKRLTPD